MRTLKASYEQMDSLAPRETFILFASDPLELFWVFLIKWCVLRWGIEPVFGGWN